MAGNVRVVLKSVFDDKGIKQAQQEFANVGKSVGVAFAAVGAAFAVGSAVAIKFAGDSIKAAEGVATANARLGQIADSMGIFGSQAGQVTNRLIKFAEANELVVAVDAEVIKATQAKLLTFKNLAATADETGGAMDRATMAAIDLAAAGFGSAETNAVQLGKALQDPIKGITALGRAGVTFTEQEREKIKVLVESGKVLDAQNLILEALETQVGGTAEATANASDKMQLAFDNIFESVGEALLPAFNELTDEVIKLTPEISNALTPVAQELAKIFRTDVLPAIQNFTNWLKSPAGVQTVRDLTKSVLDAIVGFANFTKGLIENWETIKNVVITLAAIVITFKTFQTAVNLATAAQLLFNAAAKANPYILLASAALAAVGGITALTVALTSFHEEQKQARIETTGFKGRIGELVAEQNRLKELLNASVISYADYKRAIGPVNQELAKLQGEMMRAAGAGRDLNKVSIGSLTNQLSQAAGEANRFRNILAGIPADSGGSGGGGGGGGGGGQSAAQKAAEEAKKAREKQIEDAQKAFERVSKLVRATQKRITEAQQSYDKAVAKANEDYLASVVKIRADYAKKLEQIVLDSQRRLTDAFRSATSVDIGKLFADSIDLQKKQAEELAKSQEALAKASKKLKEEQEDLNAVLLNPKATQQQVTAARRAFNDAQAEVDKLANDVKKIGQTSDPVTGLVEGLRSRLQNANELIARSAALAAEGFSQTFIEQVVSAGAETGNQLAAAILESTPQTRQELKRLFAAVENTSERGMNDLAQTIFEQQGLATRELRDLYKNTNIELQKALGDQQVEFQRALESAALELGDKLKDIKADFEEDVADLKGSYGGLKGVIDGVSRSLDSMIGKADQAAKAASEAAIKAANATRAAIGDITGTKPGETDLGLGAGGSEGLRGFGDPMEMRRLAAIQAAGSALGQFGQGFINMVTGQRSFSKNGQVVAVSGNNERRAAELIAQGFVETFAANINRESLNLALALAEEVYGVDIGGISTPGQVGGQTFNITVNAGMGTDPITVGREIVDAIKRFERSSGQVFVGV